MQIIICKNDDEIGAVAGGIIADVVKDGGANLGLATGSSPLSTYKELIRLHKEEGLSFADASAWTLDEYVGLPPEHEQSYHSTIRNELIDHIDMPLENLHTPNGVAEDLMAEAQRHEDSLEEIGGVDIQLLGIGVNGHIGFNEPSSSLASRTRVASLTASTIEANSRYFDDANDVPRLCITQGLGTILTSGIAILVAQGSHKKDAIAAAIEGPVSASCPASILQLHQNAIFVIDEEAADGLANKDFYNLSVENLKQLNN